MALGERGLRAAIDLVGGVGEPASGVAYQGELLAPAAAASAASAGAVQGSASAGGVNRGRKPGARNRATREWAARILGRGQSPLEFLQSVYLEPTLALADRLACSQLEAYRLQVAAARELAPYVHRKQPVEIDTGNGMLPIVVVGDLAQDAASDAGDLLGFTIVVDQGVVSVSEEQSDDDQSDDATMPLG